jgi:peptide/nickel transport system substrate-binding protein
MKRLIFLLFILAGTWAFISCPAKGEAGLQGLTPKNSVVISGVLWSAPSNFNPFDSSGQVAGKYQIVYENLCHYDMFKGQLTPWLATSWEWSSPNVFLIKLRKGVKWTDGQMFTADDVIYTFEVAKDIPAVTWSSIWDWTKSFQKVDDYTVKVTFEKPHYHEWIQQLYTVPIVPKHVWGDKSGKTIETSTNTDPNMVVTGAYTFGAALADKMIWKRNDNWWGNSVFGAPKPKYIVFPVSYSNNVAMGSAMKGELDLANSYLPGLSKIKNDYGLKTFYKNKPYHMPANVAVLFLNTTKKPMDNVMFRKALAYAINPDLIVNNVYGGQVQQSNPEGLLNIPSWMRYYDKKAAEKYGISYDPAKAKAILDKLGFKDVNGDGYREDANGKPMEFDLIVPSGWTDWMDSIKVIAKSAQAVGIKINPTFPDYGLYWDQLTGGKFDMAINNFGSSISPTPFTYWNWVANSRINRDKVDTGNFGRYKNQKLFKLIDQFNTTKLDSDQGKKIASQIETILMQEMPSIPIWYNGLWAAMSEKNWTNWPDAQHTQNGIPCAWGHYFSFGGYEMLLNLKPVGKK